MFLVGDGDVLYVGVQLNQFIVLKCCTPGTVYEVYIWFGGEPHERSVFVPFLL